MKTKKIPTLSADQAVSIINEAKASGNFTSEMPETEGARMTAARKTIELALQAYEGGSSSQAVLTILRLARVGNESVLPDVDGETGFPFEDEPEEQQVLEVEKEAEPKITVVLPGNIQPSLKAGREEVIGRTKAIGLPIPEPVDEGRISPMPRDLTTLDDRDLRKAHGEWHAVYSWAAWNLSLEEADALASAHLLEHERHKAFMSVSKLDPETKKPKTIDVLKAEVESTPVVVEMADRNVLHANQVRVFKGMVAIYQGNVDRLSREITARHSEWQRSQVGGGMNR